MKTKSISHDQEQLEDNIKYYYAVRDIRDAQNLFLNINFEILTGCAYHCTGCYVNRKNNSKHSAMAQIPNIVKDFKDNGTVLPHIAFVGPTDFLQADDTAEVLADPIVIAALRQFRRISFVTVLQGLGNADKIAEVWNEHYSDIELEINVAFEPTEIHDILYVDNVKANRTELFKKFKANGPLRTFAVFNVFDYNKHKQLSALDYEKMHHKIKDIFETTIDFNFSIFRRKSTPTDQLISDLETVKNLFNDSVTDGTKTFLRFSFGKLNDALIEHQYNYRDGKFFISPLMYERVVDFTETFEIKKAGEEYGFQDFIKAEQTILSNQYKYANQTTECESCSYLGTCVDRMILTIYETYGIKDCLVAKKALEVINNITNKNEFIQ